MVTNLQHIDPNILMILEGIKDPEIPVISIVDLGIVENVEVNDGILEIAIMPTYTGCPAMDTIREDLIVAFQKAGYIVEVKFVLSPAWTTDRLTEKGIKALKDYGIAVPLHQDLDKLALLEGKSIVPCPRCGSQNTQMISQFGSTACKALFKCKDCLEPFDYFKCHL